MKKEILKKYKNDLLSIDNLSESELYTILDSLKHMNSKDDVLLSTKFKEVNSRSDLYRNESFESVFPELAEWYKNI